MLLNFENGVPIYLQLAEGLEDEILRGIYPEESQVPSTTEISVGYKINPATAAKGINLLVDGGILYKKRGVGMFVSKGAREQIAEKRREAFYDGYIRVMLEEAGKLGITKEQIIEMLERGNR